MCGEQHVPYDAWARDGGSPPRVRGTAAITFAKATQDGITPACAGNSLATAPRCWAKPDHPRVCGEQRRQLSTMSSAMGSPPRVRGTAIQRRTAWKHPWITPACAGNSPWEAYHRAASRDHPRVCGEQRLNRHRLKRLRGSPPRVRGTVRLLSKTSIIGRITPACAGNRRGWLSTPRAAGDHPRVCGEQAPPLPGPALFLGSPPRVRGTDGGWAASGG